MGGGRLRQHVGVAAQLAAAIGNASSGAARSERNRHSVRMPLAVLFLYERGRNRHYWSRALAWGPTRPCRYRRLNLVLHEDGSQPNRKGPRQPASYALRRRTMNAGLSNGA